MKIGVLTDSTCDIPETLREKYDINIVPLYIIHNNKSFKDNELEWEEFSKMLKSNTPPTTSQPSINDFIQKYNEMLEKYDHIIGIFISSVLSGTYNSAVTASTLIEESQKITIVDSESGSTAMALMAIEIAKKAKEGDLNETIKFAEDLVEKSEIYFIPSDVNYLKRSGRVSSAQSLLIGLLNVKLILKTDKGKLVLHKKIIGQKKAMNTLYGIIKSKKIRNNTVGFSYTGDFKKAKEIIENIKNMGLEVMETKMGNVLTTHGGPNFFALSFLNE
jgi:DegV family protein with EDD domain